MDSKQVLLDEARAYVECLRTEPGRTPRDVVRDLCDLLNDRPTTEPVFVLFDGPPGPNTGRFVEVENERGVSVRAREWEWECLNQTTNVWRLGPFYPKPSTPATLDEQALDVQAVAALGRFAQWAIETSTEQWGDLEYFDIGEKMQEVGLLATHTKAPLTADDIEAGLDVQGYNGRCNGALCGGETGEGEECQHLSALALHGLALLKRSDGPLFTQAVARLATPYFEAANLRKRMQEWADNDGEAHGYGQCFRDVLAFVARGTLQDTTP